MSARLPYLPGGMTQLAARQPPPKKLTAAEQKKLDDALKIAQKKPEAATAKVAPAVAAATAGPQYAPPAATAPPVAAPAAGPSYAPAGNDQILTARNQAAITRPREVTPDQTPAELGPQGPQGPVATYDAKGRPTGETTGDGDALAKQQAILRAREAYVPRDNNGRLKSTLIGFVRGKGLTGLVDPSEDERYASERDIARTRRAVQGEYEARKSDADLEASAANAEFRRAEAKKADRGPTYAPHYGDSAAGPYVAQGNVAEPLIDRTTGKPLGPKPDAGAAGRQERADRNKVLDARHEKERAEDVEYRKTHSERQYQQRLADRQRAEEKEGTKERKDRELGAGKLVGEHTGAKQRMVEADSQISQLNEKLAGTTDAYQKEELAKSIEDWTNKKSVAQADALKAATELNTSYGDLYEGGTGKGGFPYIKMKPWSKRAFLANAKGKMTPARIKAAQDAAKARGQEVLD